jgi:hypothetical protein
VARSKVKALDPKNLREHMREQLDLGNYEWMAATPEASVGAYGDGFYSLTRLDDGWILGLRLVLQRGVYEVVEAIFMAVEEDGTGGLTTGNFREVPLGEIIKNARYQAASIRNVVGGEAAHRVDQWLAPWKVPARGSRVKRDDVAYAALAAKYVELVGEGDRSPAATLGRTLGMSAVTISQRVREARERGLLTNTATGTAGGELTEKALSVLTNPVLNALVDDREE